MADTLLFSDMFTILAIDADGKKFDKVSRLRAESSSYDTRLTLDFNSEVFPLNTNDRFTMALYAASPDADQMLDDYDYVCYGKCFKFEDLGAHAAVYISLGGLLACLEGEIKHLQNIAKGQYVYLKARSLKERLR